MPETDARHEALYQDLTAALKKHEDLPPAEMLAVASNWLGKLIALQDQRTMTPERAMKIVAANIQIGNRQALDELANAAPASRA